MHIIHFFFFNDTATTEIYTLSLHDALPICHIPLQPLQNFFLRRLNTNRQMLLPLSAVHGKDPMTGNRRKTLDRKSTRLNSSHANISYAVFCLKKKKSHKRK